jgi:hypothetical protein
VASGPFDCGSGWSDLNLSWQISVNAPAGVYDAMIKIIPTGPYFDPIVIQKKGAFVVNPYVGAF